MRREMHSPARSTGCSGALRNARLRTQRGRLLRELACGNTRRMAAVSGSTRGRPRAGGVALLLLGLLWSPVFSAMLPAFLGTAAHETPAWTRSLTPAAQAQSTAQRTQFHSERIRMLVQPGRLTVNALYRFVAPEEAREFPLRLFFPYPQDSLLGKAEMAMLEVALPGAAWRDIGFTDAPDRRGARWRIPLIGDTTLVRAVYHQELLGPYAHYIVTTTNIWNRPLEHVRFEVFLPESARAPEFSFPFAPPEEPGAPYIYEAEDFLPDRDITVRWSW